MNLTPTPLRRREGQKSY